LAADNEMVADIMGYTLDNELMACVENMKVIPIAQNHRSADIGA
jgi:hypothetical protein